MADYTITTSYKTSFQVYHIEFSRTYGPSVDTIQKALVQWDLAKVLEPDTNWDIICEVTKVIK